MCSPVKRFSRCIIGRSSCFRSFRSIWNVLIKFQILRFFAANCFEFGKMARVIVSSLSGGFGDEVSLANVEGFVEGFRVLVGSRLEVFGAANCSHIVVFG